MQQGKKLKQCLGKLNIFVRNVQKQELSDVQVKA